jgi:hypothetical protein
MAPPSCCCSEPAAVAAAAAATPSALPLALPRGRCPLASARCSVGAASAAAAALRCIPPLSQPKCLVGIAAARHSSGCSAAAPRYVATLRLIPAQKTSHSPAAACVPPPPRSVAHAPERDRWSRRWSSGHAPRQPVGRGPFPSPSQRRPLPPTPAPAAVCDHHSQRPVAQRQPTAAEHLPEGRGGKGHGHAADCLTSGARGECSPPRRRLSLSLLLPPSWCSSASVSAAAPMNGRAEAATTLCSPKRAASTPCTRTRPGQGRPLNRRAQRASEPAAPPVWGTGGERLGGLAGRRTPAAAVSASVSETAHTCQLSICGEVPPPPGGVVSCARAFPRAWGRGAPQARGWWALPRGRSRSRRARSGSA